MLYQIDADYAAPISMSTYTHTLIFMCKNVCIKKAHKENVDERVMEWAVESEKTALDCA